MSKSNVHYGYSNKKCILKCLFHNRKYLLAHQICGNPCLYLHLVSLRLRLLLHAFLHSPVLKLGLLDMVTLVPYKTFFPFYIHHFLGQERFYKQGPKTKIFIKTNLDHLIRNRYIYVCVN